ncbi:response regulator transcription factor [Anaerobacillus sp. HL2]|nr:response regulator transcription factor [Anaerobacillus sp. HL2]
MTRSYFNGYFDAGIGGIEAAMSEDTTNKGLMLTMFSEENYLKKSNKCGCNGYVLKKLLLELISAMKSVLQGQKHIFIRRCPVFIQRLCRS